MRSIVVEIKNDYAAVLSDDGSITKIRNKNYVIGQVITMKNQKIHIPKKVAIGVASAALVLTTGVGAWAYTTPTSYVSLDVNPSIEYTLNTFDRVIDVNAVNDDGQAIVDEIDINSLENQPIEEAIVSTVEQISQDGYFDASTTNAVSGSAIEVTDTTTETTTADATATDSTATDSTTTDATSTETTTNGTVVDDSIINGGIIITTSNENSEVSEELANELQEAVEEVVGDDVVVEALSVGLERVQEARELGVTPGKLNLVQKLQASSNDPDSVSLDEWLNKPVKVIMKAIKENKKANSANDAENDTDVEETTETEAAVQESEAAEIEDADDNKALVNNRKVKKADKDEKSNVKASSKEQVKTNEKVKEDQEKALEKSKVDNEKAIEKVKVANEKTKEANEKAIEKAKEESENAIEKAKEESEAAIEKQKEDQKAANEKAKESHENAEKAAKENQEKVKENQGKNNKD